MSASADIVTAQATGLTVPNAALTGSRVTVDDHGTRTERTVQTGVVGEERTQILSGLEAGEQVVETSRSALAGAAAAAGGGSGSGTTGALGGGGGFGAGALGGGRVLRSGAGGFGGGGGGFRSGGGAGP
jgi:hypothetical protein